MEDMKRPRVFVENYESDMGLMYCGAIGDTDLHSGIGHLIVGDLCDKVANDSVHFVLHIKDMTDAEVEALPDL